MALLAAAAVIGLATASDYGITVDEFNADDYGPKSLAWYSSGFTDRAAFETVEATLWYYGPWFQVLTAIAQSFGIAEHWTTRHAMTFIFGLAAIAALFPIARLAIGRWAGLIAIILCLTTGYLYGSIFFTPIDVPFMFAMTWATFATAWMASRMVPSWPATIAAGIFTGLAIATRSSGIITHVYLAGAMLLCGLAVVLHGTDRGGRLLAIVARTAAAIAIAWTVAIALWPWLQIGNPFLQFWEAFRHFANHPNSFEFVHWGRNVTTTALPWHYIPGQMVARLPEGFLLLLAVGLVAGIASAVAILYRGYDLLSQRERHRFKALAVLAAQSRPMLVVWAAAILPIVFVIVQGSTLYDGIRHVLFLIPMMALIAGYGFIRSIPLLRRFPVASAIIAGGYTGYVVLTLATLHPLQYVAVNAFAGGVQGAYGRFDLDYWAAAATTALRRLEARLDLAPKLFVDNPPRLLICIANRHEGVQIMYRRPWRLATEPDQADYIIETERWRCVEKQPFVLIDEVKRNGQTFAWIYARRPHPDLPDADQ